MVQLVPRAVARLLKRHPALYSVGRKARFAAGATLGARSLSDTPGRVHYNDFMLEGVSKQKIDHYNKYAVSFVDRLEQQLDANGRSWADVDACLEIGSGYGRVIRHLVQRLPPDRIHVSDVLDEAVRFCAREFGVRHAGAIGTADFPAAVRFDVIFLLSVFTHIRIEQMVEICRHIVDRLAPGGILAFTIQGRGVAEDNRYLETLGDRMVFEQRDILKQLDAVGYYYRRYDYYSEDYGVTLHTHDFIEDLFAENFPALEQTHFGEQENFYQDVFVYRKRAAFPDGAAS